MEPSPPSGNNGIGNVPPLEDVTTVEQFALLLRRFHVRAGKPSYRTLQDWAKSQWPQGRRVGLGRTRIYEALTGKRLPGKDFVGWFVEACGGSPEEIERWSAAWERVADHHFLLHPPPETRHRQTLTDLQQRYDELRDAHEDTMRQLDSTRQQLAQAVAGSADLQQRYDELRGAHEDTMRQLDSTRQQLAQAVAESADSRRRYAALRDVYDDVIRRYDELLSTHEDTTRQLDTRQQPLLLRPMDGDGDAPRVVGRAIVAGSPEPRAVALPSADRGPGTPPPPSGWPPAADPLPDDALRRAVALTRAELSETVQALAAKADLKRRVEEASRSSEGTAEQPSGPSLDAPCYCGSGLKYKRSHGGPNAPSASPAS
jgi:hypothetical protein